MSSEVANNSSSNIIKVSEIGMAFGREYYTALSREPSRLHLFYAKNSTLLHANEGDLDTPISIGSEAIQNAVNKNSFLGSRFIIGSIDCHPSQNGGILVNVLGQVQKRGQANSNRHFMQTFFLAEQPAGYFILNENLRFLERLSASATTASPVTSAVNANEIATTATTQAAAPIVEKVVAAPVVESVPVASVTKAEPVSASVPAVTAEVAAPAPVKVKKITTAASKQKASTSPVSTPVTANAAPVVVEEAVPAGPSSWAQLAAVQQNKWASGVVSLNKGTSIPSEEKPKVIASTSNNRKKASEPTVTATSSTSTPATATTNNTRRPNNTDASKPAKLPFVPEASLYITGITNELKSDVLRAEFSALGALAHFDVKYNSGTAFVEYADAAIAKILLEEGGIVINGTRLTVEKRRVATRNFHGSSLSAASADNSKDKDAAAKKFTPTKSNRRERPANKNVATPTTA